MRDLKLIVLLGYCLLLTSAGKASANQQVAEKVVEDERFDLNDKTLSDVMQDFGKQISDLMTEQVDQLVEDVKQDQIRKARAKKNNKSIQSDNVTNSEDLAKFKNVNKILSKDTQKIIAMAGKKNEGELTQSGLMGDADAGKSLLQRVGGKLQTAGSFIGHHLSSLTGYAPRLSGKLTRVPMKLRKLMHWPTFLKYKIRFNKVYKSLREELYRQMIYLRTQTLVGIQNLKFLCGRVKHLLKATQFADWTDKEYKKVFDNVQAETPASAPDIKRMSPEQKAKLEELAKQGATIFGQPAPEAGPTAPDRSRLEELEGARLSRRKRDESELEEDDDDEVDRLPNVSVADRKSAEEDYEDLHGVQVDPEGLSNELLDESKLVEQFSAQFDEGAGSMDDLEDILDSALEGSDQFEPIDLRKTGCVSEPENQDSCGACYAYVSVAAASYFNCINSDTRQLVRYNTRFVSDCGRYLSPPTDQRPKLNGCRGGRVSLAIKFIDTVGIYEFMDYEFARRGLSFRDDKCAYPRPSSLDNWQPQPNIPAISVPAYNGVYYANLQLDEIDLHLRTVGPVFANIRVWDGFKNHGSGIVDSFREGSDTVIHSMLIVGHDKDPNGKEYYIIWNSHGTSWGENGFARVYAKSLDYFKIYIGGLMPENNL